MKATLDVYDDDIHFLHFLYLRARRFEDVAHRLVQHRVKRLGHLRRSERTVYRAHQ
jgi:hypothetical protein